MMHLVAMDMTEFIRLWRGYPEIVDSYIQTNTQLAVRPTKAFDGRRSKQRPMTVDSELVTIECTGSESL